MGFEPVLISEKINKDSHIAVRFMGKEKIISDNNKISDVFLFGSSSLMQVQSKEANLNDLAKPSKPPNPRNSNIFQGSLGIGDAMECIVNELDKGLVQLDLVGTDLDEEESIFVDAPTGPSTMI